ncbi:hypothetical protein A9Q89_07315 [Gammaproteobacteria bacterium 53_120_T64]|nr:hypothetical protein A9Q89_07315 [Gammaproteobacteria bacterium 53_120_T64]
MADSQLPLPSGEPHKPAWRLPVLASLALALCWYVFPHPALIAVIGILPFALLFTLKQPFLLVLGFVIFSFFRIHEVFPQIYNFKIPLLLSMASLGALFWHLLLSAEITPYWRPELTAISVFFLLVFIGIPLASNRPVAIAYFSAIYWKIIVMTFAIAWLSRRAQDFALASRLITISGLLVGIVALSNKAQGIGLVEGTRVTIGRAIGSVLGDPNDLALVLMFPVAFALSLVLSKGVGRFNTALGIVSTPVLFFAIIATQSRGGLLGILSIFAVFAYRRITSKTLFFGLSGAAIMLVFLLADISGRSSGGVSETGIDESAMGRLYAWEAATGMAQHNPLSGVGLNNFYANYFYYSPHWDGLNHAVHSTWFGVLAETGFLGLGVFLVTIGMLIKTALQTLERIEAHHLPVDPAINASAHAVLAGLLGTVISATFLTQGFTWPIYILLALVVALAHWVDSHLTSESLL